MAALIVIIVILAALVLYLLNERRKVSREIAGLSEYLTKVQDRDSLPSFDDACEGELKILQSEIYKVSSSLQEMYSLEHSRNLYLSDMLANVSHQIKTPLAAITLLTDRLRSDISEQEKRDVIRSIRRETDHVTKLVKDLLACAQIDAGVLPVKMTDVSLRECAEKALDPLFLPMELKEIEAVFDVPETIMIHADVRWMSEALSNIIKNSIEHTPQGGKITIRASADNLAVILTIADTGCGIAPEKLERIFERFSNVSPSPESTGIGLSLSREIILLHQGKIDVASRLNEGTVFTVRLVPASEKKN